MDEMISEKVIFMNVPKIPIPINKPDNYMSGFFRRFSKYNKLLEEYPAIFVINENKFKILKEDS
jgi:hypothetical protein